MKLVVDASAALYLLSSADGLAPLTDHDASAPALLWSEVTSVINETSWRRELSERLAEIALERMLTAPITRRSSADLYRRAARIARALGWAKTYDAEYVALAQLVGAHLVTRDARLRRGAAEVVAIVGPDDVLS